MIYAPAFAPDKPHVVYYVLDENDWALYVGCTCDLTNRLSAHRGWMRNHPDCYVATTEEMTAEDAYALESQEIAELGPVWNVRDNTAQRVVRDEQNALWWWDRYGKEMGGRHLRERLACELSEQARLGFVQPLVPLIADEIQRRYDRDELDDSEHGPYLMWSYRFRVAS